MNHTELASKLLLYKQDDIQMEQNIKIFMEDCVRIGDKVYFFSRDWNGLYQVDYKSESMKFIGIMPEEHLLSRRLCAGIVHYHGKLILIPMTAEKIWVYNLKNGQWRGIERKYVTEKDSHKEIFRAVKYKKYLIFVGSNYPAVIRMDMDTYSLEYLTEPYNFLMSEKTSGECFFRSDWIIREGYLLAASCLNNYVLQINMDTFEHEWIEVGNRDFRYSGITWDGKFYWLSPRTGTPIVRWDGQANTEYYILPEDFDSTVYNFLGVQYNNGKLIFPGMQQDKTLVIDAESFSDMEIRREQYNFFKCLENGDEISQTANGLLRLKLFNQNEQYECRTEINKKDLLNCYVNKKEEQYYRKTENEIWRESSSILLPLYIALSDKKDKKNDKSKIGVNIWKKVLN